MAKLTTNIPAFRGQWAFLSNMWRCEVYYDGHKFNSVEHAYVAAKLDNQPNAKLYDDYVKQANSISPYEAKKLGRGHRVHQPLVTMEYFLRGKFTLGTPEAKLLLSTGDLDIEELNNWNDKYWGICNGEGQNHLGKLLMKIRTELRYRR